MLRKTLFFLCLTLLILHAAAQTPYCGQHDYTERLIKQDPTLRSAQLTAEKAIATWQRSRKTVTGTNPPPANPIVLPVVVHIIHNNGPENISDQQVLTAIQHLNEAYANIGYYDPSDGVDTHIQFCMAQRDPDNHPTNGITRDVSAHTVMDPVSPFNDDLKVKDINRWNPRCYINIWIVASISPSIAGYATMPGAHGSISDGIIITSFVFGTSYANDIVVAHEMGHYLGLYHTFEGGCTNTDCSVDGDKVCDTPPDQSTAAIGCDQSINSCHTDALSGFTTDQDDLTKDYMDYGNYSCMKVFTQGQADRMVAAIQTVRSSLLACKCCMEPCPTPVAPGFTLPSNLNEAGSTATFNNTSTGAVSYEWYVNGALVSTDLNLTYTFPSLGNYTIRLVAKTGDALCLDAEKTAFVYIACPQGGCYSLPSTTPDTCAVSTFQKKFGGFLHDFAEDVAVDAAGNLLVTGNTASFGAGSADVLAVEFDPAGHILWSKAIGTAGPNTGYGAGFFSDGSSLLIGVTTGPAGQNGGNLYKLDKQGNLLWTRLYRNQFFIPYPGAGLATTDGGILIAGNGSTSPTISPLMLMKTDAVGNIQWAKQYLDGYAPYPRSEIETGSQFAGVAETSALPLVFVVDKNTGALLWAKTYTFPGATSVQIGRILSADNGWLVGITYSTADATGLHTHYGFMYTDDQGIPRTAYTIDGAPLSNNGYPDIALRPNGNIVVSYGPLSPTDPQNAALAEIAPDGHLVRALRYFTADAQALVRIQNTPDGGIVGIGNSGGVIRPENAYIFKTDSALRFSSPPGGTGECTAIPEFPTISQPVATATSLPTQSTDLTITASDITPTVTDIQLPSTDYCSNPILCNTLYITGIDSVCVNDADTLTYLGNRAAGCGLPVHWQLGSAAAVITGQTDSTIRLVFKDTGAITLHASLTAKCSILKDSIALHAFRSPSHIDLGDDLALCRQSTVTLDAGAGFKSYTWQDGSGNATFTAWLPGQYYVNAKDYCDNSYSDTITITLAPDIPFDLGPDTTICRDDTLRITAPSGFKDYSWTPDYRLDNPAQQSIQVSPQKDTTYLCTATKSKGCQVIDSIRIMVTDCPKRFLPTSVYFPNAFTPDNDGKNDLFRPIVTVPLDAFYLVVFNRLGEKLFETKDYTHGWDGNYKGRRLDAGSFVWYAQYHIFGTTTPPTTVKGVLTLVR